MINFDAIPIRKTTGGPWHSFKLAIIITFMILGIMGFGALITEYTGNRELIMASLSTAGMIIFIAVVIRSFIKGFFVFKNQKSVMRKFAEENNWHYAETNRTINDLTGCPPLCKKISSSWNKVRCSVSGELENVKFEFAHITYVQSTGLIGAVSSNVNTTKFAWLSILIIKGHPNIHKYPNLIYEIDDNNTYIICGLNALYKDDVQTMFGSVFIE